jgi:hypothetical protein
MNFHEAGIGTAAAHQARQGSDKQQSATVSLAAGMVQVHRSVYAVRNKTVLTWVHRINTRGGLAVRPENLARRVARARSWRVVLDRYPECARLRGFRAPIERKVVASELPVAARQPALFRALRDGGHIELAWAREKYAVHHLPPACRLARTIPCACFCRDKLARPLGYIVVGAHCWPCRWPRLHFAIFTNRADRWCDDAYTHQRRAQNRAAGPRGMCWGVGTLRLRKPHAHSGPRVAQKPTQV